MDLSHFVVLGFNYWS